MPEVFYNSFPASRQCKIVRYNTGDQSTFHEFELFEETPPAEPGASTGELKLLLAAKKVRSKPSKYIISSEKLDSSYFEQRAIVKLTSNYIGTRFKVYDGPAASQERHQLATVVYGTNILGMMGPRKVKVLIPSFYPYGQSTENACKYVPNKDVIWDAFKSKSRNILLLQNKEPLWNEESRSYVLNFNGRVTRPSVKNFQLISRHDPDLILIQFGRTGGNTFSLDFREPASAGLAFAIALSSIDSKLACE